MGIGDTLSASIQANATIWGAVIQGGLTLLAGVFVIVAAFIQYRGNLAMVQHERDAQAAEQAAYQTRMGGILLQHISDVMTDALVIKYTSDKLTAKPGRMALHEMSTDIPDELQMIHWRDHALLGTEFVRALTMAHLHLRRLRDWKENNKGVTSEIDIPDLSVEPKIVNGLPHYPAIKSHLSLVKVSQAYEEAIIKVITVLEPEVTKESLATGIAYRN